MATASPISSSARARRIRRRLQQRLGLCGVRQERLRRFHDLSRPQWRQRFPPRWPAQATTITGSAVSAAGRCEWRWLRRHPGRRLSVSTGSARPMHGAAYVVFGKASGFRAGDRPRQPRRRRRLPHRRRGGVATCSAAASWAPRAMSMATASTTSSSARMTPTTTALNWFRLHLHHLRPPRRDGGDADGDGARQHHQWRQGRRHDLRPIRQRHALRLGGRRYDRWRRRRRYDQRRRGDDTSGGAATTRSMAGSDRTHLSGGGGIDFFYISEGFDSNAGGSGKDLMDFRALGGRRVAQLGAWNLLAARSPKKTAPSPRSSRW